MSYLVLARKWRPKQFDDVVGQRPITQTLENSILSERIAHAYIFSGPRGVGKTTTARILAKALNCKQGPTPRPCDACSLCEEINRGSSVDIIEIDGASNNSVDDIRDLREKVHYIPARARYKVYIIDEVHMLSTQAFNALLKTLEEPPKHIVFILATTEAHKIPLTILSRCQRYDFRRISFQDIRNYLDKIIDQERDIKGDREAVLRLIARCADGSLRDALSLMDQVISLSEGQINIQQVLDLVSLVDRHTIEDILRGVIEGRARDALICIERIVSRGHNLKNFVEQILQYIRDAIIFKLANGDNRALDLSAEEARDMAAVADSVSQEDLLRYFDILARAAEKMRFSSQPRLMLEMALIRMSELTKLESLRTIIHRLDLLEQMKSVGPPIQAHSIPDNYEQRPKEPILEESQVKAPDLSVTSGNENNRNNKSRESFHANVNNDNSYQAEQIEQAEYGAEVEEIERIEQIEEVEQVEQVGLNWPKIVQQVKGESMSFGSLLESLNVNIKEEAAIVELVLKNDNPFYLRLIEDKKNQALLQAVLTKVSGKSLQIKWSSNSDTDIDTDKKEGQIKQASFDHPLDVINSEPIIQIAMDIFSAEVVKTTPAKEGNMYGDSSLDSKRQNI